MQESSMKKQLQFMICQHLFEKSITGIPSKKEYFEAFSSWALEKTIKHP